ncbi:serine/threonine-protein kinase [Nocardia sp. NPDC060249]|uniref:serine/threonine-protein kinase n=1 Tax=Nocardia sp. NPDC060249 TaxID=3347082 RepID=UPI0036630C33
MLESGAGFAGYRLERVLGQGGMGTVYLAEHPRLPRSVALKVLNREFSADQELQRRFEREADVVAQLDHPSIVGVYDRGSDDGYLWIAMQFIRGTDAATWDSRAHEPGVTARLIGETASALDYANRHGVLHRDVKPGNILIADSEHGREIRAVLTDFGIARVATANTQLTATGTFTATLAYASPEQLSGEIVDHRSDQYSLACTLFAMYAGHPPYTATNPGQVVAGHLSHPVPRLTTVRTDLPPAVDSVIARAMAKRRDERFGSAKEFTDAVRDVLEGRHVAEPTVFQQWADPGRQRPGSGEHAQQPWADPARQWHGSGGYAQQPWIDSGQRAHGSGGHVPQPVWGQSDYGASMVDPRMRPGMVENPWHQGSARGDEPPKGTAMFVGFALLLVSLTVLVFLIWGISVTLDKMGEGRNAGDDARIAIPILSAVVLYTGTAGILMLRARTAGRVMSMIAAVPIAIFSLVAIVGSAMDSYYVTTAIAGALFVLTAALVACAASPSTGRWIRYHKALRTNRW